MTENAAELARAAVAENIESTSALLDDSLLTDIATVAAAMSTAVSSGRQIVAFGNGGSAADATHIAAEFLGRFLRDRGALPAISLSDNTSAVTAIGNDYGFELVFARQIEAYGRTGDVALGISTSGNSENVLAAMRTARDRGMVTVALTGAGGGGLAALVDHLIAVPSTSTPRIQECQILIGHILCDLVERQLT